MPKLTPDQLKLGISRIRSRIVEVEALDPFTLEEGAPEVDALQAAIDETLSKIFGVGTDKYNRYRKTVNWAEDIPSFGGDTNLSQYRGDIVKGKREVVVMLNAAIRSLEEELMYMREIESRVDSVARQSSRSNVFIGHGGSPLWRELKDFLRDRLGLHVDEFASVSPAGITTAKRLNELMESAVFAFLVMTAEDDQPDGKKRARENVVHEAGLFQGRLGFGKAIILLEDGCEEFSNIHGLGHISFPKGKIAATFEQIRLVLERERVIGHHEPHQIA